MSVIAKVCDDSLSTVFGFLQPEDLGRASRVCRRWSRLASQRSLWDSFDLRKLYPGFNDLRGKWPAAILERYELSEEGAPFIGNRTLIPVVRCMSRHVEGGAGVTVFIKPKGCSLDRLIQLVEDNGVICLIWDGIPTEFRSMQSVSSEVVVMTNSVLQNSRNLSVDEQQALIDPIGCEIPDAVSATLLLILTFMNSPVGARICLYPNQTYTRCQEETDGSRLIVGGFSPSELDVVVDFYDDADIGVGGQQKF